VEREVELGVGRVARVEASLVPMPGEIRVISVPHGARVEAVAGSWRKSGETPLTLQEAPTEQAVELAVSLRGYRTERREVELAAAEVRTLNFGTLVAEAGAVELRLANDELRGGEGVQVLLDGREMSGRWRAGALTIDGLEAGQRSLEITHRSYRSHRSHFTVSDQQTTRHEVRLEPLPGQLVLSVSGPAAGQWRVEVDDKAATPASGNVLELPAGRELALRVSARGWEDWERKVTLGAAEELTVRAVLEQVRGPMPGQHAEVELPGGVKLELVWIRPGEFVMGSPAGEEGRWNDEGPQTRVRLSKGYWLGKYPVTQGQWQALMGNNPSHFKDSGLNAPVESVSWNEAMEFARRLTEQEHRAGRLPEGYAYTLPSEAQWEYGARAGTTTRYHTGNSESDLARAGWYSANSGRRTHPVGQKAPNAWGLYDVHGNVLEWTRSWSGNHPGGSVTDYEGPSSGSLRVYRGGSWGYTAQGSRSAPRNGDSPGNRYNGLGFRLALSSLGHRARSCAAALFFG
jgi:formylglycine-generating enzyme required for sulfatase activity